MSIGLATKLATESMASFAALGPLLEGGKLSNSMASPNSRRTGPNGSPPFFGDIKLELWVSSDLRRQMEVAEPRQAIARGAKSSRSYERAERLQAIPTARSRKMRRGG